MSGAPLVGIEPRGAIAVLTLANPPVGALSAELVGALGAAVADARVRDAAVVVVRSGIPGHFGGGGDLKLMGSADADAFSAYLDGVRAALAALAALPVTIAAIDGYALGGGLELALACTFRIMGPKARVGLPEVTLGLLPGAGGTQRLTQLIGRERALDLMLTGRHVDAAEALRLGIVGRVTDGSAESAAIVLATTLAERPREAVAAIVRCADAAVPYGHASGMETEGDQMRRIFDTEDARRGIAAFLERRRTRDAG